MLKKIFDKEKAMKHAPENKHYADIYESWFETKRYTVKNLLEIGVHKGGALRAWLKYFPIATVYGVDIKDKFDRDKPFDRNRLHFAVGDQTDKTFMLNLYDDIEFDVIIDDASHQVDHQWDTFNFMFQRVKKGGVYIVEDIHSSYWPDYKGGFGKPGTFIEKAKQLADYPNYKAYKKMDDRATHQLIESKPTWMEKNVKSVVFTQGMCFIERR